MCWSSMDNHAKASKCAEREFPAHQGLEKSTVDIASETYELLWFPIKCNAWCCWIEAPSARQRLGWGLADEDASICAAEAKGIAQRSIDLCFERLACDMSDALGNGRVFQVERRWNGILSYCEGRENRLDRSRCTKHVACGTLC
mmetsp:Transcript_154174/g.273474  ORF Transcript_154174/g.273474 Transcript_154174/m.273474 type:complete len:144 (+) Transcript_154174:43-474(+)